MKQFKRLPHEQAVPGTDDSGPGPDHNATADVEGHRVPPGDRFLPGLPGTGGDIRRPVGGGEIEDDVEGHGGPAGERFLPGLPGTGGDIHRPSGGGE